MTLIRLLSFAALLAVATPALGIGAPRPPQQAPDVTSAGAPPPGSTERFAEVPDFDLPAHSGGQLSRADLAGSPWVAIPFFVRCTGPCPSITRDVRARLHDELKGTGIRIVSFSIDPTMDTVEALADYASAIHADPAIWTFVRSDEETAMHRLLNEGFKIPVQRDASAEDPGQSIVHGTRMAVVDPGGRIAGWYDLADPALGEDGLPLEEAEPILDARYALITARLRALAGLDYTWGAPARRSILPMVNAILNGTAFVLLVLGMLAIKSGRKERHEHLMKAAFVVSAAFLGCYLYYHFAVIPLSGGPTKYNGTGAAKAVYLLMLLTHIVLAVVNLPMVLRTFWLAHREDWERHRRLARWTLPIWLYVSVTGVLVYLVLYPFNPPV